MSDAPHVPDFLDSLLATWAAEAPGLDTGAIGIDARILRLAKYLERRADDALAPLGLTLWQLDVLAFLLHAPARQGLQVSELLPAALLSPAAMTNRLDRLEQAGWLLRFPDPSDRRATRVRLTPSGRTLARRALQARAASAAGSQAALSPDEARQLAHLLRTWLRSLCPTECAANSPRPT